jgi:hypothetical protein
MITEKSIREAYIFLRKNNHDISDEVLQFILDASLEKLHKIAEEEACIFRKEIELNHPKPEDWRKNETNQS